jgi:hypothetical protein
MKTVSTTRRLFTVSQFIERHPWCTKGGMRHFLFYRESNGLDKAILKIGKRLLIDEDKFFEWLEQQD